MTRFDLDHLHTLVVVADAGSLTAAAPRLCRSQSAVSEQVRKLEQDCGLPLLSRSKMGVSLTPAGRRLVDHARELLALSDAAYQDIQGTLLAGDLRLAITDYFRPASISAVLRRLRLNFPRLRLHVSIRKSAEIEQDRGNGEFDIGLSMRILEASETSDVLVSEPSRSKLGRESLFWVAHEKFALDVTAPLPLVVLPDTCSLQRLMVRKLSQHGINYEIVLSASGIGGLHFALEAGLGIACLNVSAIPPGMRRVDLGERLPKMPDVEFSLVAPRAGEASLVTEVRHILAEQLAFKPQSHDRVAPLGCRSRQEI